MYLSYVVRIFSGHMAMALLGMLACGFAAFMLARRLMLLMSEEEGTYPPGYGFVLTIACIFFFLATAILLVAIIITLVAPKFGLV